MHNELIPEKSWWKINGKWLVPLAVFALVCVILIISTIKDSNKTPEVMMPFDEVKWKAKDSDDYPFRNKMYLDLLTNTKLKRLKKEEVIKMLGEPDRIDSDYLFYKINQEHISFFPLHTKTLVVRLSNDSTANKVMIHN